MQRRWQASSPTGEPRPRAPSSQQVLLGTLACQTVTLTARMWALLLTWWVLLCQRQLTLLLPLTMSWL